VPEPIASSEYRLKSVARPDPRPVECQVVRGHFFLGDSAHGEGRELVAELLTARPYFFPFEQIDGRRRTRRAPYIWLVLRSSWSRSPRTRRGACPDMKSRGVTIVFASPLQHPADRRAVARSPASRPDRGEAIGPETPSASDTSKPTDGPSSSTVSTSLK